MEAILILLFSGQIEAAELLLTKLNLHNTMEHKMVPGFCADNFLMENGFCAAFFHRHFLRDHNMLFLTLQDKFVATRKLPVTHKPGWDLNEETDMSKFKEVVAREYVCWKLQVLAQESMLYQMVSPQLSLRASMKESEGGNHAKSGNNFSQNI